MSFEDSIPSPQKAQPAEGTFITFEQAKAVNILLAAATVAQKAGAFSLKDASAVYEAIQCFVPVKSEEPEVKEDDAA